MGMSILLQASETDHAVKFTPPDWAYVYEPDEDFDISANEVAHTLPRDHRIGTSGCNLWWIELGGDGKKIYETDNNYNSLVKIPLCTHAEKITV